MELSKYKKRKYLAIVAHPVGTKYGAPHGRYGQGQRPDPEENIELVELRLPFEDGAYDKGGAYWGGDDNLFVEFTKDFSYIHYFRRKIIGSTLTMFGGFFKFTIQLIEGEMIYQMFLQDKLLFEGKCAEINDKVSYESIDGYDDLIYLLSLRPGDTDSDFFSNYNEEQLAFCKTIHPDDLSIYCRDKEEGKSLREYKLKFEYLYGEKEN